MKPMFRSRTLALLLITSMMLLTGCATPKDPASDRAEGEPLAWPPTAQAGNSTAVYRVDPDESELRVLVAPAGSLARLGHRHVVGGPVVSGALQLGESVFSDLKLDVGALQVDPVEWRADEGWEPLDEDAIQGTRRNLLGEGVLDAERFPHIEIRSVRVTGPEWQPDVTFRVRVRGIVSEHEIPVGVHRSPDRITLTGSFDVDQTALGMTPFSAAGGALRVADTLRVRFRIVARPAGMGPG